MYNFNWSRQNNFDAQVTFVDHTVKNITDALHQTQLWANTLFVCRCLLCGPRCLIAASLTVPLRRSDIRQ